MKTTLLSASIVLLTALCLSLLFLAGGTESLADVPTIVPDLEQEVVEQPDPVQTVPDEATEGLTIDLDVTIGGLTPDGLAVSLEVSITNPTPLGFDMGDIRVTARSETGQTYIEQTVEGSSMRPNSTSTFAYNMAVPLDLISERVLRITVDTTAGALGIAIPLNATVTVRMPDIATLINMPVIALAVDVGELSSAGLLTTLRTSIDNRNPLSIDIGDMQMVVRDQLGNIITASSMAGSSIAPGSKGAFTSNILIPLEILSEESVEITIDMSVGAAGIAIPIAATMAVNMPDINSLITMPTIGASVAVGQLTSNGLHMTLQMNMTNPNPLSLELGDTQMTIKGQFGNVISTTTMTGVSMGPNSSNTLTGDIFMPLAVLGEEAIVLAVETSAGIAGITLPIAATVNVIMPDLGSMLKMPEIEVSTDPRLVVGLRGLELELLTTTTITNDNEFDLMIGDVQMSVLDAAGTLVKRITIPGGEIPASGSRSLAGSMGVAIGDFSQLIGSEWVTIKVEAEVGIGGMSEGIPIGATIKLLL